MFVKIRLKVGDYLELNNLASIKILGMRPAAKQEYIGQDILKFSVDRTRDYLFVCDEKSYNIPGEQIVFIEFPNNQ